MKRLEPPKREHETALYDLGDAILKQAPPPPNLQDLGASFPYRHLCYDRYNSMRLANSVKELFEHRVCNTVYRR